MAGLVEELSLSPAQVVETVHVNVFAGTLTPGVTAETQD